MPRWEPDAEQRLRASAMELFATHGYDAVTISQIAEHAGLTRRSFFRYFPDKREVLFGGSDAVGDELRRAVDTLPAEATPNAIVDTLVDVLARAGDAITSDRAARLQRRDLIDASPELQERERTKLASTATAITACLAARGIDDAATVGAIWSEIFRGAYLRALSNTTPTTFRDHLDATRQSTRPFL